MELLIVFLVFSVLFAVGILLMAIYAVFKYPALRAAGIIAMIPPSAVLLGLLVWVPLRAARHPDPRDIGLGLIVEASVISLCMLLFNLLTALFLINGILDERKKNRDGGV